MISHSLQLALPSLVILVVLLAHSVRALPRPRAAAFWIGVASYGLARGAAVRWISASYLGGAFPYVIRDPLIQLGGVSLQEVAGWAIVLYLGWWLGARLSTRIFRQILCACLFLAAASWAVESTATAVGWWRWTVPVPATSLTGVPFIGIVDWFFSGTDFLLPFIALTAPAMRARPARYLTLLAFPGHFGAHMLVDRPAPWFPIPPHHLAHWLLLGGILWLAARCEDEDRWLASEERATWRWLPLAALGIMMAVLAASDLILVRRPRLLTALLPLAVMGVLVRFTFGAVRTRPTRGLPAPARGRTAAWSMVCLLGVAAGWIHATAARREKELTRRLDHALALRDSGDLLTAASELELMRRLYPNSHVPNALLGEMRYRAGRLEEAHRLFTLATKIQQSYGDGLRYLAVIQLRLGRPEHAARHAAEGLDIEPEDPQLLYLALRARGGSIGALVDRMSSLGPRIGHALAALAFEVDDLDGAHTLLEAGLARWPADRIFHQGRVKLALARRDAEAARHAAETWLRVLPGDGEALDATRRLNPK